MMRSLGLTPEHVLARNPAGIPSPSPSLGFSMTYAAACFAVVSVIAYSIWAYRLIAGTAAMYAAIALVYVGLSGITLSRLVIGRGGMARFAALFAAAFAC